MNTLSETIVNTIEYEFCVESLGWEMLFSIDYEVTPGEPEDRREINYSLGTPASDPACEITKVLLIRIKSDVYDDMRSYNFCIMGVHRASAEADLFGKWFMAWIKADEDDRVKLKEACFEHAGLAR